MPTKLKGKHIHFMGVGGIGMSAIAQLSLERGASVSGCDLSSNSHTRKLEGQGVVIHVGHDPSHLDAKRVDVVVHSSAVPPQNPELVAARKQGIEIVSRAAWLARLLEDKQTIAITGSHGKTTTTWVVADLLLELRRDPSVMIGGVAGKLKANFRYGKGDHFVTEVDESDGSLLSIHPWLSVLTNVDLEHLDFYRDINHVEKTFAKFIKNTQANGWLVGYGDDPRVRSLFATAKQQSMLYGLSAHCDVRADNIHYGPRVTRFDVCVTGQWHRRCKTTLVGEHNLQNVLAGIATACAMQLDMKSVLAVLAQLEGVKRRFEVKGKCHGATVVEDYAHHPREIEATVKLAGLKRPKRIIGVVQPHRYTRLQGLFKAFSRCFTGCDVVVVMDVYSANENPIEGINSHKLATAIGKYEGDACQVIHIPRRESVLDYLHSIATRGDMVLFMGAGDVGRLSSEFLGD